MVLLVCFVGKSFAQKIHAHVLSKQKQRIVIYSVIWLWRNGLWFIFKIYLTVIKIRWDIKVDQVFKPCVFTLTFVYVLLFVNWYLQMYSCSATCNILHSVLISVQISINRPVSHLCSYKLHYSYLAYIIISFVDNMYIRGILSFI